MDETTLTLDPPLRAFWMKVGEQKRIPATRPGEKKKRHIFGGYNWKKDTMTWTVATTKNSFTFIEFLEKLLVKAHPKDMGAEEIQKFITCLAVEKNVAASTQNQALSAILFLYRHVLHIEIEFPAGLICAQKSKTLPVVLTHQEAMLVISNMSSLPQLMAKLLYGFGLRLMECLRLRVKDIDFGNRQIIVRDGKGEDDRSTILPDSLVPALQKQIETVRRIHQTDLSDGFGEVWLPYALERKYPNASRELAWQYLFPSSTFSADPASKSAPSRNSSATRM